MFDALKPQPQDKILALMQMFKEDPRTDKIDLGVGVYKDATGLTPVMRAVKAAEHKLWETETTKAYTGLAGDPAFGTAMAGLILGGVLLNALAQLLLKAGANRLGPVELQFATLVGAARDIAFSGPIVAGLACYVLSVGLWIVALTRVDVSVAYPMLSIGYVGSAVAAWLILTRRV